MGIIWNKYRAGVNLGGWISQCAYEKEHISKFISQDDINAIASWGVDHIRLPFDYPILEDDSDPFVYKNEGLAVIDKAIEWCKQASLNVVLDLHKAPGYAFMNKAEDNILFTDDATQKRFVSLWETLAKRYKSESDNLIFELMNEITDPHGEAWNQIARRAIEAIWTVDPNRYILLGGPDHNAVTGLDSLEIWADEHLLYNFHFYEPFLFTHQRASWTPLVNLPIKQPYPGKIEGIEMLNAMYGGNRPTQGRGINADTLFDYAFLEEKIAPAIAFIKRTGKELYCGEYGAIDNADLSSREHYLHDINALFDKHNIGRAVWTYKGMNFPCVDASGKPISDNIIKALSVKKGL